MLAALVLAAAATLNTPTPPTIEPTWQATVVRIIDGDTLVVEVDLWPNGLRQTRQVIRLAGIDTPELHAPKCPAERTLAERARLRLAALVAGGNVWLRGVYTGDKYGRAEAQVLRASDGADVGQLLLADGTARPYDGRSARSSWCGS